ncbi:MAG: hypothetical protein K9M99_08035 [Candidatus Cloacimonetes bacterium]|nr:hypothetical protein [Candidatus Cloacimonadota bacterium]
MRKYFIVFMMFFVLHCLGMSPAEIKSCGEYYYGEVLSSEGVEDLCEAKDKALLRLSQNISVMVSGDFESSKVEIDGEYSESVEKIMRTYSGITLRNLTPVQSREAEGWQVLCYLHQDSLASIYNARKQTIISIYEKAIENEEKLNLSSALQWYYYSLILMNSIPLERIEYQGADLRLEAADRIKQIIEDVKFIYEREKMVQDDIRDVYLRLEYKGKPVKLLEFSYMVKGVPEDEVARDGRVCCRLTGASITYEELEIEIQYRYAKNRKQMTEIAQLWDAIVKADFENERKISLQASRKSESQMKKYAIDQQPQYEKKEMKLHYSNDDNCEVAKQIAGSVYDFIASLQAGNLIETYKEDDFLRDKLSDMCSYNQVEVIDSEYEYALNKTYDGWEVRSIPVYCNYPSLHRRGMEYLVLDFNEQAILQDVNFSVFSGLYENHVAKFRNDAADDAYRHRQVLVKFLEKYRSAYMNRDMATLNQIFAEEAVIIVGRMLKEGDTKRNYEYGKTELQPDIEYLEMTKQQFLVRQEQIFAQQQDICLGFSSCEFNQKNGEKDVYGISMRQQYSSTGYSDEGYLFLLIDFKESDPMIYVRSWQPAEWTEDQLIKLSNYRVTN